MAIEKEFGKGTIQTLSGQMTMARFASQVPTGSIGLDLAIGPMYRRPDGVWQTGIPDGKIVEIFGPESSGKTTSALLIARNAQIGGGLVAYLDMEHSLDISYAKQLGVNLERLHFSQPNNGDECLNIAVLMLKSGVYDAIVVDSIAALVPKSELEGAVGDASMGSQARLMSQFFRMTVGHTGKKTKLIFINQLRNKIGLVFGNPEVTPGGSAMKYYADLRFDVRRANPISEQVNGEAQQIGHRMKVRVIKNKLSPPYRVAEFSLHYGLGIQVHEELFDLCNAAGIIEGNSWYTFPDGSKVQGKLGAVARLSTDQRLSYVCFDALLTKKLAERGFYPDGTAIPDFQFSVREAKPDFIPLTAQEQAEIASQEAATPSV